MRKYRSKSNLVMVRWFLTELCPLMKLSVSVHYLPNSWTHSTQIWHMDTSKKCTEQVQIWSWFDDFWQSHTLFTLKIIWHFQFPFIIYPSCTNQLKFEIWICQKIRRSSSNFLMVQWFLAELCPFHFKNNMNFSVSVHFLPNCITHSTQCFRGITLFSDFQISHMDTSKECAGQIRIWSWFLWFLAE
jgi:hypothetical protein